MNAIPDGLAQIDKEIPLIMEMISQSARWVHPDVYKALPVWRPEKARKMPLYKKDWCTRSISKSDAPKFETNGGALLSLREALGINKPRNWTTCHIWGYDDANFAGKSVIVQDARFYSCVANMVLLPTPLKGFTDAVPTIKHHLRVCAFHLYGWACEHEIVNEESALVRSGEIPDGYPVTWPTVDRRVLPAGTGPFDDKIKKRIAERKRKIARDLENFDLVHYPRDSVRSVLEFWKVDLTASGSHSSFNNPRNS